MDIVKVLFKVLHVCYNVQNRCSVCGIKAQALAQRRIPYIEHHRATDAVDGGDGEVIRSMTEREL